MECKSNVSFCSAPYKCPCGERMFVMNYQQGDRQVALVACEPCGEVMRITTRREWLTEAEAQKLLALT